MFSQSELSQHISPPGAAEDMPLMEIGEFHAHQFKNPIHNQSLVAHCGSRDDYSSALLFWRWSIQWLTGATEGQGVFRRAAKDALCEPISSREFFDLVDFYTACLKHPPDFLLRQNLVAAMRMFNGIALGGARTSLLAEFDDAFVAIHDNIEL